MAANVIENVKCLNNVSKMADSALMGGTLTKEEHEKAKKEIQRLVFDNLFKAMAIYSQ